MNTEKTHNRQGGLSRIIGACLCLLQLLFCGCDSFLHNTEEAKDYIRKNISENQFVISEGEVIDGVKYWKVYFVDKPEVVFTVFSHLDVPAGALVPKGYRINSNFDKIFAKYYLDEYKKEYGSKLYSEKYLYYYESDHVKLELYSIEGQYGSADEAGLLAKDIEMFWNYIKKQPYPCEIYIGCHYLIDGSKRGIRYYLYSSENDKMSDNAKHDKLSVINKETVEKKLLSRIDDYNEIRRQSKSNDGTRRRVIY